MSEKNKASSSLSAIVLLTFAVIWLVYLCAGNQMDAGVAENLSFTVSILFVLSYVGMLFLPSELKTRWVFIILLACLCISIPSAIVDIFTFCGGDVSMIPWLKDTLYIGQKIGHIALYLFLIANAVKLTESKIFRLLFIVIGLFLIFCVVTEWIPALAELLPVPLIGFEPII